MDGDRWVFGYGSLMWNPGFPHLSARRAVLRGYHRALCVHSNRYRGTDEVTGLVFGLDRGGACAGVAFEVADRDWTETLAYLRDREQITRVYHEIWHPVRLAGSDAVVSAMTYVVDRNHIQYAAPRSFDETLAIVRRASGSRGPNADYVTATADRLASLGICDRKVAALAAALMDGDGDGVRTPEG